MKKSKCLLSVLLICAMLISIFPLGAFSSLGASSGNSFFAKGIDVSRWQGNIDWKKVKSDGIQFAIIKAGGSDAGYYTDGKWEQNYKAAKAAGMPIGAYYFAGKKFTTVAEGKADAERFIKMLKGKQLEYPVYIDIEAQATKDKVGITKATIEFCKTMENAGFFVGIYASAISGFKERLEDNKLQSFAHWVAQYASKCTYSHDYGVWQYSSKGKVSGISGNVDMNYAYMDYATRIKNGGFNGFNKNDFSGITSVSTSNIKNFSAAFTVNLKSQSNVEHIGLFYSKTSSLIDGVKADTAKKSNGNLSYYELAGSVNNISKYTFDTASKTTKAGSLIKFDAGTTYYYKMVVSIGGKWYVSSKGNFNTIGKPANITGLSLNKTVIGKGSPVTATWNAASGAEQYRITLSKDGVLCEDNLIANTTTYTVPADFTAEEGSYEIGVIAKNAYSESSSAVTSRFTVNPDVTISFDADGDVQAFTIPYDGSVMAPAAPTKEGHTFVQWESADADVSIAKAFAKINNVKASGTYTASWSVNEYPVTLIDSVSNKTLRTFKQDYGTELNLSQYENNLPTHTNYTFSGWSVPETYRVSAGEQSIYAIYKWNEGTSVSADITAISREKSNSALNVCDGYSIDVEVRSPSIVNGATSQIVNGRVVVVLKTNAGRLLCESESAAFVLYPNQNSEVSKTINVFVPFVASTAEGFATVAEAYVVNNYRSAGLISNVAHDENLIAAANVDEWMFSATRPVVGQNNVTLLDPSLDYDEYNYTVTTNTTVETPKETLEGFSPISSSWVKTGTGTVQYVKSWPKFGSDMGCAFDKSTNVGSHIYNSFNHTPKKAQETTTSKITVTERVYKAIYYHWCRNQNTGNRTRNVTATKMTGSTGNKYYHFHAFLSGDPDTWNHPEYSKTHEKTFATKRDMYSVGAGDWTDKCLDSYWWSVRLPTYLQTWTQYDKKFVQQKVETATGTVRSLSEIPQGSENTTTTGTIGNENLNTTVKETVDYTTTHYYAFKKAPDVATTHEDKNLYDINVSIGTENAGKDVIVYVYKTNVMSDATMEYLETATVNSNGNLVISNAQMLEACSVETGDFTIAVALKGETDAMIVGTIAAPKPVYTVKFVANTDAVDQDGNIVLQQIGEDQHVSEGQNAVLPEMSAVPEKQGYHFIGWSQSATNVNDDLVVEAEYEKNEYTVAFVDWQGKKVELQKCTFGETPEFPELPDEDLYTDVEWVIGDGNDDETIKATDYFTENVGVTSDMVISTKYFAKTAPVKVIQDPIDPVDGEDAEDEELPEGTRSDVRPIGDNLPLSEYEDEIKERVGEDIHFYGWLNYRTGEPIEDIEIVEDIAIVPQYSFDQDVEMPTASVATGEYNTAKTIALSCDTENAAIYYTLDDTDPAKSSTAILYESPFTVTTSCRLRFIAMALGYNNSEEGQELYAINTPGNTRYHVVTIYSNTVEELADDEATMGETEESKSIGLVRDGNHLPAALFESAVGFDLEAVYFDAAHEDEFILNAETVAESMNLYAVYTLHHYTVNFTNENGTLLDSQAVAYMDAATPPEPPTRNGYIFVRWDGDYEFVTEDMTLHAVFIPESEYATIAFKPNRASRSISLGSTLLLNTVITKSSSLNYDIEWSSDSSYIASVDDNGNVRGVSVGTTTVTATLPYTGASASINIIVTGSPEYSIMLVENSVLDIDNSGFIRRVPAEGNTVAAMRAQFENNDLVFYDIDGNVLGETALVGTGTVVKFFNEDGEEADAKTFVMTGDMNQDGYINNRDVAMITRYLVDKETADLCQYAAIDVNGDGSVNNRDASMLSRYLVGKEVI